MQLRFAETDELPGWRPAGQARALSLRGQGWTPGLATRVSAPHGKGDES
jgi:hypothetical protein